MDFGFLLRGVLRGYCLTVFFELPVLWFGLERQYSRRDRVFAAVWLSGVSYPLVIVALPALIGPYCSKITYMVMAELAAPVIECLAFRSVFGTATRRDMVAIVVANLFSFGMGECLKHAGILTL
jgi:hypothetical protein